jgi:2-polyprenyl-3-methyl-5-hydroxy-6-metoxy-1,4-benzoquinol methylase
MKAPSAALSRRVQNYVERQKGMVYNPIPHPAFAHIPYRHGPERFDLIAPHLGFKSGTVLDIGSRFGYMAHRLEDMGYRVTAVEKSQHYVYFMREFRDLCERKFEVVHDSVFNLVQPNFDIVFALNIFHHFMKTREALEQLDDFLRRLKCRMMIYQAHHPSDIIMTGAYRNMTPEEATSFIAERLSLSRVEEIGTYKRRRIFKLTE